MPKIHKEYREKELVGSIVSNCPSHKDMTSFYLTHSYHSVTCIYLYTFRFLFPSFPEPSPFDLLTVSNKNGRVYKDALVLQYYIIGAKKKVTFKQVIYWIALSYNTPSWQLNMLRYKVISNCLNSVDRYCPTRTCFCKN